jgi:hypothetical protein
VQENETVEATPVTEEATTTTETFGIQRAGEGDVTEDEYENGSGFIFPGFALAVALFGYLIES